MGHEVFRQLCKIKETLLEEVSDLENEDRYNIEQKLEEISNILNPDRD